MASMDGSTLDQSLARAGDGVCVVDTEGRILLWNRAAERILGYTAREAGGRPCCEVFLGRDDNGNRLCYQSCHVMTLVKMNEPVQHFEMRTETKAGQKVWLDVSVLSLGSARTNGSATTNGSLVVHLFRDVTATKELVTLIHERLSAATSPAQPLEAAAALTRRELEVLRMVATGLNTKAIAERLHVSPATIRNHVQNILGKLGAHSRLEAVAHATRHRLL
jgi:PAS domain S-box-containing protein